MKGERRRPTRLWVFFWGRKRRGFPGLLVAVAVTVVGLGLLFGLPGGAELSRWATLVSVIALLLLIGASLVLVALAALFPRRRR